MSHAHVEAVKSTRNAVVHDIADHDFSVVSGNKIYTPIISFFLQRFFSRSKYESVIVVFEIRRFCQKQLIKLNHELNLIFA